MIDQKIISIGANLLRNGGLVAFPTETVYGLGANAFDARAVARIFEVKERPSFDPLIVHISNIAELDSLVHINGPWAMDLAFAFWPGPLTMVLPKKEIIPDIVTSGLSSVGVRMPSHPVALALIREAGCPVAAPSANKFGRLSPTTARHVEKQLVGVDLIIDGGETTVGIESTVITFHADGFEILRPGAITRDQLIKVVPESSQKSGRNTLSSPGLLDSHYSPTKPLFIISEGNSSFPSGKKAAYLAFMKAPDWGEWERIEILTPGGDLADAAINLFGMLHRLEESDAEIIIAEEVPETGIGIAVMDRLKKAAFRYKG